MATIKPTDPQFRGVNVQTPPNGQVNIQGLTLSFMIQTIWFLTPDMIVGAPASLDKYRWDVPRCSIPPASTGHTISR